MMKQGCRIAAGLLALAALSAAASGAGAQAVEWTLRVTAESAVVRLRPDAAAPAVATAPKGTVFKSYGREAGWFRVLAEMGRGGFVAFGYLAASDVAVEAEAGPPPEVWRQVAGEYRGAGLSLRLGLGPVFFGGGDFETGSAGLYERTTDLAEAFGAVVEDFEKKSMGAGLRLAADLVYRLTRSWGCGLRVAYERDTPQSFIRIRYAGGVNSYTALSTVTTSVLTVGAGVYFERPLGRAWTLAAHAGPAFHFVDFEYGRDLAHLAGEDGASIVAQGRGPGIQGGLGLEWRFHRRYALFVEAQGRLASVGGFEGEEAHYWTFNLQSWTAKTKGTLFLDEGGGSPRLVVLEDGTEAGASKAKMDLSGVGLAAGFRVRF